MTNAYLTNITPDSLSGMIFGLEGIKNIVVLLNGPSGCKFYHSSLADSQSQKQKELNPLSYPEAWFFGQPRVPCTYLDKRDYVYGSKDKLLEAVNFILEQMDCDLLAVVNSPGAALIGDDLENILGERTISKPIISVETPGYSQMIWQGYSAVCLKLIESFKREAVQPSIGRKVKKVNILGYSIFQKYFLGDMEELKRLFSYCDIELNCALCCNCSLEEIRRLNEADLNIVLDREYGLASAQRLQQLYGTDFLLCSGLPIGFAAVEELFRSLKEKLAVDIQKFIEESEKARANAFLHISRINSLSGLPKGTKFALHGNTATCLAFSRVLINYFAMVPDSISLLQSSTVNYEDNPDYQELCLLLRRVDGEAALNKDILLTEADMVFADGNIIAKLKACHKNFVGVEISLPTLGYVDVIKKTHLGIKGALFLTEQVLNGLLF